MMMPLSVSVGLAICTMLVASQRKGSAVSSSALPPTRFLRFPNLLGAQRANEILRATAARSQQLMPSSVTGTNPVRPDYRRSQVMMSGDEIAPELSPWIRASAPEMARVLRVHPFVPVEVETQVTVSGDGDYFKEHTDSGAPETASRQLSWVYYTHLEPQPFVGGELVMHGPDGKYIIEPENDSLIVFPSECLHEVTPVTSQSRDPMNGRVTINGWVRS